MGDGFHLQELRAALEAASLPAGGGRGESLLDVLDEATAAGMLREARDGYQFGHALIRQTLHDGLGLARRQELHRQAAEALERVYAGNFGPHVATLAMHFRLSGGQGEKALAYAERAAERALASYAYAKAVHYLEQALEVQGLLNPDDKAKRCDLLLAQAEALLPAGEPARVFEAVAPEALALAEMLEDRGRASRTCQLAWEALFRYGSGAIFGTAVARQWAERADRYAAPGTIARVEADLALNGVYQGEGRLAEIPPLNEAAMALARQLGDPNTFFRAATMFVTSMWNLPAGQFDVESMLSVTDELCGYPREGVRTRTLGGVLHYSGMVYLNLGERARAVALWNELADPAQRTRDTTLLLRSLTNEIDEAYLDGKLEAAVAAAMRVREQGEKLGAAVSGRQLSLHGFRPTLYLKGPEEALRMLTQGAPGAVPAQGFAAWAERSWTPLALAYLGRSEDARLAMGELSSDLRIASEEHVMIATAGVNLLEAAVLLEDQGTAALLASHLRPVASVAYSSPVGTCVARHLGAAAALLGDGEAARAYYAQALEVTSKLGFRPEIALTHLGIAELLLDEAISSPRGGPGGGSVGARHAVPVPSAAQRNEALQHLHFAIAELRDMKMEPALQRALQLEKRATEPTPLRRVAAEIYPDGLSEREVEVLRLLAAGRSNREIGGQLYISLNTVARHVNHIFVKVGVANRVEAAAYAHRLGLV